jgi:hypothetical protein
MKIKMTFASYETLGFESSLYNLMDCKIITIEGEEKVFWWEP